MKSNDLITNDCVKADMVLVLRLPLVNRKWEQVALDACIPLLLRLSREQIHYQLHYDIQLQQLLVFVHCPDTVLLRDYKNVSQSGASASVADLSSYARLQLANDYFRHRMDLMNPYQPWSALLRGIYALHDPTISKQWLSQWSRVWLLQAQDIEVIRSYLGPTLASYFCFLQDYFHWLVYPAVVGLLLSIYSHFIERQEYPLFYALVVQLWSLVFLEHWQLRQHQLIVASPIPIQSNPKIASSLTRKGYFHSLLARGFSSVVMAAMLLFLIVVLALLFLAEVLCSSEYTNPLQSEALVYQLLPFLPTMVYALLVPQLTLLFSKVAVRLNAYELQHREKSVQEQELIQKQMVFHGAIYYAAPLLGGLVYTPFRDQCTALLEQVTGWQFQPALPQQDRFKSAVVYFLLTGQLLNLFQETLLPWLMVHLYKKPHAASKAAKMSTSRRMDKILMELQRPDYDMNEDYLELVIQYGYVVLFSVVWPWTPLCAFVNNWIESRSDALKLIKTKRRPLPRPSQVEAWTRILQSLAWLGLVLNIVWVLTYNPRWKGSSLDISSPQFEWALFVVVVLIVLGVSVGVRWLARTCLMLTMSETVAIVNDPHVSAWKLDRVENESEETEEEVVEHLTSLLKTI